MWEIYGAGWEGQTEHPSFSGKDSSSMAIKGQPWPPAAAHRRRGLCFAQGSSLRKSNSAWLQKNLELLLSAPSLWLQEGKLRDIFASQIISTGPGSCVVRDVHDAPDLGVALGFWLFQGLGSFQGCGKVGSAHEHFCDAMKVVRS